MRLSRLIAVAILGCLMLLVGAAPAAAQDSGSQTSATQTTAAQIDDAQDGAQNQGLQVVSSTTYAPDPEREQITVTASYTMTNLQADEVIDDSVRSYFYTKWVIALPATATDFAATSAGEPLDTTIAPHPDGGGQAADDPNVVDVVFGTITLPFNLNYQQNVQLDVTFTIPGAEPRTDGTVARVNDSFLSFSVWAAGDPGLTDVRIIIPSGFRVDLQGDLDELQEVTLANGDVMLEATGIQNPRDFFGQIFGRNDAGLLTATAPLPGAVATIRAWPDDPEWVEFVANAIRDDVPVIQDLTGLDWPAGDIEVIETLTPYLLGYGGWFNASSGIIEIGDRLERDLILHELGHAWFNDELIDGRWITEGLAEEFASRAIAATSGDQLDPNEPDLDDPVRVPLAAWASPWTLDEEDAFAYEQYHYNASWWVLRQITNDIGLDAFSDVLIALRNDELPYPGTGPIEQTDQSTQWTHLYDLLEARGATDLDTLFRRYVLVDADINSLTMRRVARSDYANVIESSAGWSAPLVLRRAMTEWRFDDAGDLIEHSLTIVERRDAVDALAAELDIMVEHPAKSLYETATTTADLDDVHTIENEQLVGLQTIRDGRADLVDHAIALGTTVAFPPMTYDDAVADITDQRAAIAQVAALRGQVDEAARDLDLQDPGWPTTAGPTDFAAAAALAEARLATLTTIHNATVIVEAPRSLLQNIGLFRSDPNESLALARTAFERDELDQALMASATAEMMIDQAASIGRTRVLWAAAIVVVIVLAMVGRATWHRRRKPTQLSPRSLPGDA